MSEPNGNHGQGRWNDNSVNKMHTQTHSTLLGARGSCMKMEFFEGVKPPEKNKKHTISAKDEHVRAHCSGPNSPRNLQVNMKSIIFSVAKSGSCHQCIGWVRCLADRLIEGAYPWRQSASKVSGDAFTPWGGFFLEAFLLVQDRRLTYDVRILTCQTATSCVPHEAMGGVKTRLFVYGPLKGSAADVGVR